MYANNTEILEWHVIAKNCTCTADLAFGMNFHYVPPLYCFWCGFWPTLESTLT